MKKMLILGGAGYVGGYMTDLFNRHNDYCVTVYDSLLYEPRYLKEGVDFIFGDVRDYEKLGGIINGYDIVVMLAAIVGDGACTVNTVLTGEINVDSVKWLVDNYRNGGTVVFMSSCSVYGMNSDPVDETAAPNPLSLYGETKLCAERYIVKNAKDHIVFRLGTLYGISDTYSRLRFDLLANSLTLSAFLGEELTVCEKKQWRPVLHVRDVAHAVLHCLTNNIRGLYNLTETNVEISELASVIAESVKGTKIAVSDRKFEDLRDYRAISDRIRNTGWVPKYTLLDGIKEIIGIMSNGRIKDAKDPVYYNEAFLREILGRV